MMKIKITRCAEKLQSAGIQLREGAGVDSLLSRFKAAFPQKLLSWSYRFAEDTLTIEVADGTNIPTALSNYGEVVVDDSLMG